MNGKSCYTLYGSQPYVLTANWPTTFTPPGTRWVADNKGSTLDRMLKRENQRNYARVFNNQIAAENYVLYKQYRKCGGCPNCMRR